MNINNKTLLIILASIFATAIIIAAAAAYLIKGENFSEESKTTTTSTAVKQTTTTTLDETASWKTYVDLKNGYTIKYPSPWVYKVYGVQSGDSVVFASTSSHFPPEQTDAPAPISLRVQDTELVETELTQSQEKLVAEGVVLNGNASRKFTLLPGRENELDGDSKYIYIEIKLKNGKYLIITQHSDYEKSIFEKMLNTITVS